MTSDPRRTLFIGIETINRELNGYVLLAHLAVQRGWDVILASRAKALAAAEIVGCGILMQNSGARGKRYPANPAATPGLRYVHNHQETLIPRSDDELMSRYAKDLSFVDLTLSFGTRQRDLLLDKHPNPGKRVVAVGSPRFDVLDPSWRSVLRKIARPSDVFPSSPWIMVNTNFHAYNESRFHTRPFEERFAARGGPAWTYDKLHARKQGYKRLYEAYIEFIRGLATSPTSPRIVVRPHPSEDHQSWRDHLGDLDNVSVIHRFAAVEWIERSMATMHTGCTTGIESRFLGRPALRFNPFDGEIDEPPLPNRVSIPVTSPDHLLSVLASHDGSDRVELTEQERTILRPHLVNADGPVATKLILDAFDELAVDAPTRPATSLIRGALRRRPREHAARLDGQLRRMSATYATRRQAGDARQKFPDLRPTDVLPVLREFELCDGAPAAPVTQLGDRILAITAT